MIVCVRVQTILKSGTGAYFVIMSHIVTVQLLYSPTSSPVSYCTIQRCHRTATVRSHPCTVQWLYGDDVGPSIGATTKKNVRQRYSPYSSCTVNKWDRTAAVHWHRGSYFTYSSSRGWSNCCEDAEDSFMLLSWWCPFKMKKGKWPTRQLKISIDWYHFWPLLAVVGQYL